MLWCSWRDDSRLRRKRSSLLASGVLRSLVLGGSVVWGVSGKFSESNEEDPLMRGGGVCVFVEE